MDRNRGLHPKFCRQGGACRDSEELSSDSRDFVIHGAEPTITEDSKRVRVWASCHSPRAAAHALGHLRPGLTPLSLPMSQNPGHVAGICHMDMGEC